MHDYSHPRGRKGQGIIEVMIYIILGLLVLTFIVLTVQDRIGNFRSLTSVQLGHAALADLRSAGEGLSQKGVGSSTLVTINLPDDVKNITISGRTLYLYFYSGDEMSANADYDVYGSINVSSGRNFIDVHSISSGICFGSLSLCP